MDTNSEQVNLFPTLEVPVVVHPNKLAVRVERVANQSSLSERPFPETATGLFRADADTVLVSLKYLTDDSATVVFPHVN
jgi:hypothetical protein